MLAVVTGAGSGMGVEITRSLLEAGYDVIMACNDVTKGQSIKEKLSAETGRDAMEVMHLDLADLRSVAAFARGLLARGCRIDRLMNNAGVLLPERRITVDGLENNISVNYVGPYLLTRMLLPLMGKGSRIVNMASLVYKYGFLHLPELFTGGCRGSYNRFAVYSNSKLSILLFTLKLSSEVAERGITVNASDPWIVSTPIIHMDNCIVDFLCDNLFRPVIYTPREGASPAIDLLLDEKWEGVSGRFMKKCIPYIDPRAYKGEGIAEICLGPRYRKHPLMDQLWSDTEDLIKTVFEGYGLVNPLQ